MMKRVRKQSGFALLMGLTVLVILTILGLSVMSQVGEDLAVVRNVRDSENALAIAEAGIAWGIEQLNDVPYQLQSTKDYNSLLLDSSTQYPTFLAPGDELCSGLADDYCQSWRLMTPTAEAFGSTAEASSTLGSFRVAYGDDEDDAADFDADANSLILIRALGQDAAGAKRLIEVAVTAGN